MVAWAGARASTVAPHRSSAATATTQVVGCVPSIALIPALVPIRPTTQKAAVWPTAKEEEPAEDPCNELEDLDVHSQQGDWWWRDWLFLPNNDIVREHELVPTGERRGRGGAQRG